jgi:hypothetical protein
VQLRDIFKTLNLSISQIKYYAYKTARFFPTYLQHGITMIGIDDIDQLKKSIKIFKIK